MRTKNKIWIVPMLALVPALVLAAFLVAGALPGGSGAPTVEAQSFNTPDDDNIATGTVCEGDVENNDDLTDGPCITREDSLEVSLYTDGTAAVARRVYITGGTDFPKVKARDSSIGTANDNMYTSGGPHLGKEGVDRHTVYFEADAFGTKRLGTISGDPDTPSTFTVTRSMANDIGQVYLFVYVPGTPSISNPGGDAANNNLSKESTSLDGDALFGIRVQFLSPPVVGADGPDRNEIVEDYYECDLGPDGVVDSGTTHPDGLTANCDPVSGGDDTENDDIDKPEIRSKLVAYAPLVTGGTAASTSYVLDGSSADFALADDQNSATVYAIINDQGDNELVGAEVTFEVTSEPAGIVRSAPHTGDAREIVATEAALDDASRQVVMLSAERAAIRNAVPQGATAAVDFDNFGLDDAMASRTISNLPSSAFRVSVKVTADGVEIGTINIVRKGDPATIEAGIYPFDYCVNTGADDALATDDTLNLKGDDCAMDMLRYGREEMFVVDATVKDAVDNSLSAETATVEIGDSAVLSKMTHGTAPNTFDVYTVKDDAALGMRAITVSHSDDDVDDVVLNFTVAGPPANLAVSGDADIPPNGSGMFTVTATDMLGGIPHLTAGDNDKVTVSVQPTDALVVGTDSANQVTLGDDGTATFTVFASLAADDGDSGRIIVQLGDLQDILPITFSDPTQMPGDDVTAPMGVTARVSFNLIVVSWTPDSAQNADIIVAAVFSEDFSEVVDLASFNPASSTGDPGTASFAGLASGTYNVVVAATRGNEDFVWDGVREVEIP